MAHQIITAHVGQIDTHGCGEMVPGWMVSAGKEILQAAVKHSIALGVNLAHAEQGQSIT